MRVRVKVCGITRMEDALAAAELGVDAVGFNFAPESPRCVCLATARAISDALPPQVDRWSTRLLRRSHGLPGRRV